LTPDQAAVARIRKRSIGIGTASAGATLLVFGWRAGVSLTICATVVIFSFVVFERLTERLVPPQEKGGLRASLPLLLVTAAAIALLGVLLLYWKGFEPVAGAVGLSAVVLAIVPEVWVRKA
jgi:hypothetical protein